MFATAKTPNLPDYLSFLYGIVGIKPAFLPSSPGTATGGSTTTLTDSAQNWTANQWAGQALLDVTQDVVASVLSSTAQGLAFAAALAEAVEPGDSYIVLQAIVVTSLKVACSVVNPQIAIAAADQYTWAVYNLAADRLVSYALDQPNQSYFRDLRGKQGLNLSEFAPGVVASSSNETTASALLNPEQMKLFTLRDLQFLKTVYGREYLGIAQSVGTLWGLS